jgi:hypothetical protein
VSLEAQRDRDEGQLPNDEKNECVELVSSRGVRWSNEWNTLAHTCNAKTRSTEVAYLIQPTMRRMG